MAFTSTQPTFPQYGQSPYQTPLEEFQPLPSGLPQGGQPHTYSNFQSPAGNPPLPITPPPLPKCNEPEPPKIDFKGKKFIILIYLLGKQKVIPQEKSIHVAELLAMTLKYGIAALEHETGVEVKSLNNLKLTVKTDDEVLLEYYNPAPATKKTVSVSVKDDLTLNNQADKADQDKVCKILQGLFAHNSCHSDHNTARKTCLKAIEILQTTRQVVISSAVNPIPPYCLPLILYKYNDLSEEYKKNHPPEKTKDDAGPKEPKPDDPQPDPPSSDPSAQASTTASSPKPPLREENTHIINFPLNLSCFEKEEIDPSNISDIIPAITDDQLSDQKSRRWIDYLLNGKLSRFSNNPKDTPWKPVELNYTPQTFNVHEIIVIINKLNEKELTFLGKEKIFLKRLCLLLVRYHLFEPDVTINNNFLTVLITNLLNSSAKVDGQASEQTSATIDITDIAMGFINDQKDNLRKSLS